MQGGGNNTLSLTSDNFTASVRVKPGTSIVEALVPGASIRRRAGSNAANGQTGKIDFEELHYWRIFCIINIFFCSVLQWKDVYEYPSSYSIITEKLIFINVDIDNWKYIVFIEYETKVENVNLRSNFFATGKNKIY